MENYAQIEHPHLPVHVDNSTCDVIEDKFWVPFVRSQVRYLHISHVPGSTTSQYKLDRATPYQVRQQPLVWIITMDQFWRVLTTIHSTLDYYILGFWTWSFIWHDKFLATFPRLDLFLSSRVQDRQGTYRVGSDRSILNDRSNTPDTAAGHWVPFRMQDAWQNLGIP